MRKLALYLILAALPGLAPAQDPPPEPTQLRFSWSATSQQDTLYAAVSGWTKAYLWIDPSPEREDFVGFWGTLFQTAAVQVHDWRYLGAGGGTVRSWDPAADEERIAYLEAPCENETGSRAIGEFSVWIDTDQLDLPGFKPSLLGIYGEGDSGLDPLVFYRADFGEPCGYLSEGFDAGTNRLVVKAQAVPVEATTFGVLKATYR